jgi:hypothetical protein
MYLEKIAFWQIIIGDLDQIFFAALGAKKEEQMIYL